MLDVDTLRVYLQDPDPDFEHLYLIVELANGLVTEHSGSLDPEPARVQAIRLEVAARAVRNPEGLTSETVDSYTWRAEPGRAGVYLTDAERGELVAITKGDPNPGPWAGSLGYRR